jgi:hypothetical protein
MYLAKCEYDRLLYQRDKAALVHRLEKEAVFSKRFVRPLGPVLAVDMWKLRAAKHCLTHAFDPSWFDVQEQASTLLQKVFRGHRARRRVKLMRERARFRAYEAKMRRRRKAITDIQRTWRGWLGRRLVRRIRQTRLTLTLQRLWRGHVARKEFKVQLEQNLAAMVVQKFVRRWLSRRRFVQDVGPYRTQRKAATALQAWTRGVLGRRRLRAGWARERRVAEWSMAARTLQALRFRMIGHRLLLESLKGGFGYKARYGKGAARRDFKVGEVRAIFSHFAQVPEEDRLENLGFLNLLRQSPGVGAVVG